MKQQLRTSVHATLDGSGRGIVTVGPTTPGTLWQVSRLVTTGASTVEPLCRVYRGTSTGQVLDTTTRGNGDVSEYETPVVVHAGENLVVEWSSGTTGTVMTMNLEGTIGDRWSS